MNRLDPSRRRSDPNHREERQFGLLIGGIGVALGAWWLVRGRFPVVGPVVLGLGGTLVLAGSLAPSLLRLPHRLWMRLGELLGAIVTPVVLGVVFFLVVTPIGLAKRLTGWDPLGRREGLAAARWRPYPPRLRETKHFERMF